MLVEPERYPTHQVAAGHRWRIAGDGTAINLGRSNPTDTIRVSHWDVCPAKQPPKHSPALLRLWEQRAGHRTP
jgi:hypothetical protein